MGLLGPEGGGVGSPGPDSFLIPALTVGSLAAVALWEAVRRRRNWRFSKGKTSRRRASNISFWLFNTTLAALVFTPPDELRPAWPLPTLPGMMVGFLILDGMIYAVHRLYHAIPLLWRLHALHHSDPDVDFSTAVRHHPIEYLTTVAAYWVAILAIGIPGPIVAVHGVVVFALAAATHANVRWPAWVERSLAPIIITGATHRLHHSINPGHANANFGAALSWFDRIFGTYQPPQCEPVLFGVCDLDPRGACSPTKMLLTPWKTRGPP